MVIIQHDIIIQYYLYIRIVSGYLTIYINTQTLDTGFDTLMSYTNVKSLQRHKNNI